MQKINLEDIIEIQYFFPEMEKYYIKQAMLEFGKQLLELAADNAQTKWVKEEPIGFKIATAGRTVVNKQSILDTINQVE